MNIKRYDVVTQHRCGEERRGEMLEHPSGSWVSYDDYETLFNRLEAVKLDRHKATKFEDMSVDSADDWCEWLHPIAKPYLMACCDCGLVHDLEFRIDDLNQLNFRVRRNTPETEAHREEQGIVVRSTPVVVK